MTAVLSPCGLYRYALTREALGDGLFAGGAGRLLFVMLNPSTADATEDDPTIRRCIGFARTLGYAALDVGNLFAWRATDPQELYRHGDTIGPDNDRHLVELATRARTVIAAWGAHPLAVSRGRDVRRMLATHDIMLHHLGLSKDGHPRHPLYLKADTKPMVLGEAA